MRTRRWISLASFASIALAGLVAMAQPGDPPARPRTQPATSLPRELLPAEVGRQRWPDAPEGARFIEEGWFAPTPRSVDPPALPDELTKVFVVPIHGPIRESLALAVERKVARAREEGAQMVIFELDTPGGSSAVMDHLVRMITRDLRDVYTVAYVNPKAFSAGAVISLACDEIVMTDFGEIGDSMPIFIGPNGQIMEIPEKERGKFESAFRAEIRNLADRGGYDRLLCEAMITITMEIWMVRQVDTGQLQFVEAKAWAHKVRNVPPNLAASQPTNVTAKPDSKWEFVSLIDGPGELVTMTTSEAIRLGFATHRLRTMDDVRAHYNITAQPDYMEDTWSETLVGFLTSPAVRSILLFVGILGIYIELNTPGVGLPGLVGVVAFALVFGGSFLAGLANWWEIALFALGILLIALEIFVIPGFGVAGISGIVCCLVGLLAMAVPNLPDELPVPASELDWSYLERGGMGLLIAIIGLTVAIPLIARYLPKVPGANRLILAAPKAPPLPGSAATEDAPIRRIQPGALGVVVSTLRPVGSVRVGEDLQDAVSAGEFLPPGTKIRVLKNEGNRLVVARDEPGGESEPT